ncbi:ThiJ/PfpI family protein [Histoplasma ohiense]|nr:ThiJ/PfpI family protein [Histoplasma ohiense (nom. inval.)]
MSQPNSLKVLLLPFPGFDTLDLYAPIEVLGKGAAIGGLEITFEIATVAQPTLSAEKVPVYRTLSISQAMMQLDQYEIVVQPGAGVSEVEKYLETPELLGLDPSSVREHLQLLLTFSQMTTPSPRGCKRVFLSICTGALVAGLAGVFSNMVVTTHYAGLEKLGEYCRMAGQGTVIEPDIGNGGYEGYSNAQQHSWRWVTLNRPGFGVNVISSGGISCGLDASLYLLSELEVMKDGQREKVGVAKAHRCARIMEYAWRWA